MNDLEVLKPRSYETEPNKPEKKESALDLKKLDLKNETLQQKFVSAIEAIKNHPAWKETVVDGFWNKLSANDQEQLYKGGKLTISRVLKKSSPIFSMIPSLKYDDNKLKLFGDMLADSARLMVQMDMLPAPKGISQEEIMKDIPKDQKSMERLLTLIEIFVTVFAPEAEPKFHEAKQIAEKIVEAKTTLAKGQQERMKKAA